MSLASGDGTHLRVRFDGQRFSSVVHPKWQMTFYAPDGRILKNYK